VQTSGAEAFTEHSGGPTDHPIFDDDSNQRTAKISANFISSFTTGASHPIIN
jgi:hypothetical protein